MELKQLYREIVNEHNLRPVHRGKLENPDLVMRGINPSCGDDITLQLKIENGVITEEFFSYVNPEEPFDAFNTQLTGISAETVASAPTFPELWPRGRPFVLRFAAQNTWSQFYFYIF